MNDRFLNLLGICRRAGKLSLGHDASIGAIASKKAKLCLLCSDASDRLVKEIKMAVSYDNPGMQVIKLQHNIKTVHRAIGSKAGVITINDDGFAQKIKELSFERGGIVYDI